MKSSWPVSFTSRGRVPAWLLVGYRRRNWGSDHSNACVLLLYFQWKAVDLCASSPPPLPVFACFFPTVGKRVLYHVYVVLMTACCMYHLLQVCWVAMAARWSGIMGWNEWSARHVEREFVVPQRLRMKANPKTQEEVTSSEVSGMKRISREREEVLKCTEKALEECRHRWYVSIYSWESIKVCCICLWIFQWTGRGGSHTSLLNLATKLYRPPSNQHCTHCHYWVTYEPISFQLHFLSKYLIKSVIKTWLVNH